MFVARGCSGGGADVELDRLEAKLREAAEAMYRFRTSDPDLPAGPMAQAARARRDAILPEVEGRRAEVERAAVEAIAAGDADLAEARAIVHIAGVEEWISLARNLTG